MRIQLDIGSKSIIIESFEYTTEDGEEELESNLTWPEVMNELIWPALNAWGYYIDREFTDQIDTLHQEYLENKHNFYPKPAGD